MLTVVLKGFLEKKWIHQAHPVVLQEIVSEVLNIAPFIALLEDLQYNFRLAYQPCILESTVKMK